MDPGFYLSNFTILVRVMATAGMPFFVLPCAQNVLILALSDWSSESDQIRKK